MGEVFMRHYFKNIVLLTVFVYFIIIPAPYAFARIGEAAERGFISALSLLMLIGIIALIKKIITWLYDTGKTAVDKISENIGHKVSLECPYCKGQTQINNNEFGRTVTCQKCFRSFTAEISTKILSK
jgi:hypothetical protein